MTDFGQVPANSTSLGAGRADLVAGLRAFVQERDLGIDVPDTWAGRTGSRTAYIGFNGAQKVDYGWSAVYYIEYNLGQAMGKAQEDFDRYVDAFAEFAAEWLTDAVITIEMGQQGGQSVATGATRAVLTISGTRFITE